MEYQVPQFIEVEDKIVGPLTLRQFIYIAGTLGLCVIFFFSFSPFFAILASIPVIALGAALAFYKVNGKSFVEMLEAGFTYYTKGKFFLWKRHEVSEKQAALEQSAAVSAAAAAQEARAKRATPRLTSGKLTELAWSLDVQKSDREPGT